MLPTGATPGQTGDSWTTAWITANPSPFSGVKAWQSQTLAGAHQLYFSGASAFPIGINDHLFAYVYLDPVNPPNEVMLQFNNGTWEHRAYWGANVLPWGVDGTVSRKYMGPLPALGQWVRLEVPASAVGVAGTSLNGMAFTLNNGRATWDRAGKVPAPAVAFAVSAGSGSEATTTANLTVILSAASALNISVDYAVNPSAGSATNGAHH